MHVIDYAVIGVYIAAMMGVGLWAQRRASQSIDGFFLGNNEMPWWALGASGMASNLDVSGTMVIAALVYALGMDGFFVEIRGGVVLVMAFFMVFMGKWNRRANVMTTAEWMEFRFGEGRQGQAARVLAAIANLVFAVWVVTYFAAGAGLFLGTILDIDPDLATLLMVGLASVYTITSGLYGVVYTDVFQGVLIGGVIVWVVATVMMSYEIPAAFEVSVPLGDGAFQTVATTRQAWTDVVPAWTLDLPGEYAQYNLLGLVVVFYLFRSTIDGMSAPGGYIIQRFYAAKDEREAGLLSLFWILLLAFRWPFVAAIAIMGISVGAQGEVIANPEAVLPTVLLELFPVGLKGLMVAGLIAAAMSTFDSVVNAGAAYWVRDLYQRFVRPDAAESTLIAHGRGASVAIVVLGTAFTFLFSSLNDLWGWLTLGLGVGLIVPQFLRWYWWRFNGYGYAGGTAVGMLLTIGQRLLVPDLPELQTFFLAFGGTLVACVGITLATRPTAPDVLREFVSRTRPFGLWHRVRAELSPRLRADIRTETRRDIVAILIAVPWQLALFMTAMVFVTKRWDQFFGLLAVLAALSVALYLVWYRNLRTAPFSSGPDAPPPLAP
ncbi:sodium:solute symporter family transporter [Rubrivirga sp.]|uniref:sodium:solute symporter family transporter n=1 Tax=Rubrivirga sp. TaxID=1885344 RepID=UPI003B52BC8C